MQVLKRPLMGTSLLLALCLGVLLPLASFASQAPEAPQWMWYPEPDFTGEQRWFRKTFDGTDWTKALLTVVSKARCDIYVNDVHLGTLEPSKMVRLWNIAGKIRPGINTLGIRASVQSDADGILLRVTGSSGEFLLISDGTWRASPREVVGWLDPAFDDSQWARVMAAKENVKPKLSASEYLALQAGFAPKVSRDVFEGIRYWVEDPMVLVFRDSRPASGNRDSIKLIAGRNEQEGAQIVLRSSEDVGLLGLEASSLKHRNGLGIIPREMIELFPVGCFHVPRNSTLTPPEELAFKAPADVPDILLEDSTISLTGRQSQPVYIRVTVPKNAAPGFYDGFIRFHFGEWDRYIPVQLEVLSVDFPDRASLWTTMWVNLENFEQYHDAPLYSDRFWQVAEEYARMMSEHHGNVLWVPTSLIQMRRRADGGLDFDFTLLERWVSVFAQYGVAQRLEMSHLAYRTADWTSDFQYATRFAAGPTAGKTSAVSLEEFVQGIQEYFEARGWLDRVLLHIADEPIKQNYRSYLELSQRVHSAAPKLRRFDAIHYTDVIGAVEIMVPQLDFFDENFDVLSKAQKDGKIEELWFYTCWLPQGKYPNRLLDYGPAKTRLIHWANYLYDAVGFLHFGFNWWRGLDPNVWLAPGDPWIVYPTRNGLLSSLRYEAMREGIEDYEYFLMHERLSRKRAAGEMGNKPDALPRTRQIAMGVMKTLENYSTDPIRIQGARERLLREIVAMQEVLAGTPQESPAP